MKSNIIKSFIAGLMLVAVVGCAGRLESGGAYYPVGQVANVALYKIDASYSFAYTVIDSVFTYERDNRVALWAISPKIKHSLDAIRPTAVQVNQKWAIARSAYEQNPIAANMTALETVLQEIQKLAAAAQAAIVVN
jgi:hypothetical protein